MDFDPEQGIIAGHRWERASEEAASRCKAVLCLISRAWLTSEWCWREFELASKRNKLIIPTLVEWLPYGEIPAEIAANHQLIELVNDKTIGRRLVSSPASNMSSATALTAHLPAILRP
jgi:hypothetical protein